MCICMHVHDIPRHGSVGTPEVSGLSLRPRCRQKMKNITIK